MKVKLSLPYYQICPKCKSKIPIEIELELGEGIDVSKLIEALFTKKR